MFKKITFLLFTLSMIVAVGTLGYVFIEGWPLLDSIYFTIITLTTIGYSEIHPLSDIGRIYTLFIIILGVGNTAYIFSLIFQYILEMNFSDRRGRKKMEKLIKDIKDHTIICGYGNMGELISAELKKKGNKFVIIDLDIDKSSIFKEKGYPFLIGNASDDDVLKLAGIQKAKTIVCVVTSDAENVFISLTARTINIDISIISRVFEDSARPKLIKAGANKIISPYTQASHKIVQTIINPAVDDFLEFVSDDNEVDYQLAEVLVTQDMICTNKKLKEIKLKEQGLVIVGIKRIDGNMVFAPHKDELIVPGDRILAIGRPENFSDIIGNFTSSN